LCIRDETGKEMPWSLDNAKHNEVLVRWTGIIPWGKRDTCKCANCYSCSQRSHRNRTQVYVMLNPPGLIPRHHVLTVGPGGSEHFTNWSRCN
jgi:hypothetical protein